MPCNGTLLSARLDNLLEVSRVLFEKFDGKVVKLVQQSDKSARKLVSLIASNFPCYYDSSTFNGREVLFLKRAQIFVGDIWHRFSGKSYGEFNDINSLTMFADYRVPQSLVYFNVLNYSDSLMAILKKGIHIDKDSEFEVEIRGSSIWAVELIHRRLKERNSSSTLQDFSIYPCTIDYFLWEYAKRHTKDLQNIPIHRTRTIFY